MTEYEKEVYLEYLKTIPVDITIIERDSKGRYILPPPDKVFSIDSKGK